MRRVGIEVVGAAERDEWRRDVYETHNHRGPDYPESFADVDAGVRGASAEGITLWTACAGVAELERLIRAHAAHLPRWLLLESVREPFDGLVALLGAYACSTWDACGRRFLLATTRPGPLSVEVSGKFRVAPLQHPDRDLRMGVSLEAQEQALGLPAGYTDCCGATVQQRRAALAATSNVEHLAVVLACVAASER